MIYSRRSTSWRCPTFKYDAAYVQPRNATASEWENKSNQRGGNTKSGFWSIVCQWRGQGSYLTRGHRNQSTYGGLGEESIWCDDSETTGRMTPVFCFMQALIKLSCYLVSWYTLTPPCGIICCSIYIYSSHINCADQNCFTCPIKQMESLPPKLPKCGALVTVGV